MSNAVVPLSQKLNGIRDLIEENKEHIFQALPKHVTPDRLVRTMLTSLRKNPALLDCSKASLMAAITEAATLGLETDGVLGHAYLVPFKNEVQLLPGYKGLIDLCRRSGNISTIFAHVVRPKDLFDYEFGLRPRLIHKPSREPHDGTFIATYAVCHLRDGGEQFEVMTFAEIEAHMKKYSRGYTRSDSPWKTNPEAMHKKTVLRQLVKMLPVSAEVQRLVARDEVIEAEIEERMDTMRNVRSSHVNEVLDRVKRPAIEAQAAPESEDGESTVGEDQPAVASDEPASDIAAFLSACENAKDFPEILAAEDALRGEQGRDLTADEDRLVEQAKDAAAKRLNGKKSKPAQGSLV